MWPPVKLWFFLSLFISCTWELFFVNYLELEFFSYHARLSHPFVTNEYMLCISLYFNTRTLVYILSHVIVILCCIISRFSKAHTCWTYVRAGSGCAWVLYFVLALNQVCLYWINPIVVCIPSGVGFLKKKLWYTTKLL